MYTRDVFRAPHDHMRHAIHVSEVLESAISTAREMHRYRSEIYSELPQNVLGRSHKRPANEYAAFQISTLQNLKLRSDSNRARLGQEINYVSSQIFPQLFKENAADLSGRCSTILLCKTATSSSQ